MSSCECLILIFVLLLRFAPSNAQTFYRCGVEQWAAETGSINTYGTLGVYPRASSNKYIDATACDCAGRCGSSANCLRWALRVYYLGYATFFVQKCYDANNVNSCGFNATCYMKNTPTDVYDGSYLPDMTDGAYPIIAGVVSCPPLFTKCSRFGCCRTATHICHPQMGCLSTSPVFVSGSPFSSSWFSGPLALAGILVGIGLGIEAAYWISLRWSRATPAHVHRRMGRRVWFLCGLAMYDFAVIALVFTEFIQGYRMLANFRVGDYGFMKAQLLDSTVVSPSIGAYPPGDYAIKLQFLVGQPLPVVLWNLDRLYVVFGTITPVPWFRPFQAVLLACLPLEMLLFMGKVLWKLFIEFHNLRDSTAAPALITLNFISDLAQPLMVNFVIEPFSRAWNVDMFETWGMTGQYIALQGCYFLSQIAFFIIAWMQFRKQNVSLWSFDRFSSENMSRGLWLLCCFYILWEANMVFLSFIYRTDVPHGPVRLRVWYYYIAVVVAVLLKHLVRGLSVWQKALTMDIHNRRRSTVARGSIVSMVT